MISSRSPAVNWSYRVTSIEIADELLKTAGKAMEPVKKVKLIVAIYRLNTTTEGGVLNAGQSIEVTSVMTC